MFSLLEIIGLPDTPGGFGPDWVHQAIHDLFGADRRRDEAVDVEPRTIDSTNLAVCCK